METQQLISRTSAVLEGKEFIGSNFTVKKKKKKQQKKTVPFVAHESEIITEMPAHLHLQVSVWYNSGKTDSLFTRRKVDLYNLSSFRRCPYTYADLDLNEEESVLSQLAKQFCTCSKNRAKEIE